MGGKRAFLRDHVQQASAVMLRNDAGNHAKVGVRQQVGTGGQIDEARPAQKTQVEPSCFAERQSGKRDHVAREVEIEPPVVPRWGGPHDQCAYDDYVHEKNAPGDDPLPSSVMVVEMREV